MEQMSSLRLPRSRNMKETLHLYGRSFMTAKGYHIQPLLLEEPLKKVEATRKPSLRIKIPGVVPTQWTRQ